MRVWSEFYAKLFGFEEQKYFDIKGKATGLFSQAMIAPDKAIRIPLNESQDDKSQIEEFIRDYNGEGIQHLALTTDDIFSTVEKLRARGVRLQDTIETYYELVDKRVPGHGEDLERLRKRNRILIDGDVEATRASCSRSSPKTCSGRSSSRSSSARAMKASATAISRRCTSRSSSTRSAAA